jgi:dolichol-phosphate mannosyltransferase
MSSAAQSSENALAGPVWVVVPTYNEAANVPELAEELFGLGNRDLWLCIVDDGSPDGTADVARGLSSRYEDRIDVVEREGKQGLGTAYVAGFSRALDRGANLIVQMDADLSHSPKYLPEMFRLLERCDVVVGSRYAHGGGVDVEWSSKRRVLSSFANATIRAVTGVKVRDVTSGFKAFRATAFRGIDLSSFRCKGFGFQAEVAYACQRKGRRVEEFPIVFMERRRGDSKMSIGIMLEALWRLSLLRLRRN